MRNKALGFTLIELLIAVSILSALLFTGTYMYQMLAGRWDKELGEFNASSQKMKNLSLLSNVLRGIHPYIILDEQMDSKKPAFLFVGGEERLLSVTRSGLFEPSHPEVFRIILEQNKKGLFNLIYQSISTKDILVLTAAQEINFKNKIVLLEDLDEIKFGYLGWNGFLERSNADQTGQTVSWRNGFSGIDNQLLPEKMTVYIKQKQKEITFVIYFDQNSLRFLAPYYGE